MQNYELALVLPGKLAKTEQQKVLGKVKKEISSLAGKITKTTEIDKRRLAYPIKKHEEGVYFLLDISLPVDKIGDVNRSLNTDDQVLRHLLVRK